MKCCSKTKKIHDFIGIWRSGIIQRMEMFPKIIEALFRTTSLLFQNTHQWKWKYCWKRKKLIGCWLLMMALFYSFMTKTEHREILEVLLLIYKPWKTRKINNKTIFSRTAFTLQAIHWSLEKIKTEQQVIVIMYYELTDNGLHVCRMTHAHIQEKENT